MERKLGVWLRGFLKVFSDIAKFFDRKHVAAGAIGLGAWLLIEHLFSYGYTELYDIIGHEFLGLGLIIFGFFWASKKGSLSSEITDFFGKFKK